MRSQSRKALALSTALVASLVALAAARGGDTGGIPGLQGNGGGGGGGGGGVTDVHGTTNRVTVSGTTGSVTFSTPQDTHTAATPQFAGIGIGTSGPATGIKVTSGIVAVGSQTVTSSTPPVNVDATVNNAGAIFDGLESYNLTDTASLGSTTIIQRRVGGASKFAVEKSGRIQTGLYGFPPADGSAYQVLTTDGSGHLYFATPAAGGGGGGGGSIDHFSIKKASTQTAGAGGFVSVQWLNTDTVVTGPSANLSWNGAGAHPERITASTSGFMHVDFQLVYTANGGGLVETLITRYDSGGSVQNRFNNFSYMSGSVVGWVTCTSASFAMSAGDYIVADSYYDTGSNTISTGTQIFVTMTQ